MPEREVPGVEGVDLSVLRDHLVRYLEKAKEYGESRGKIGYRYAVPFLYQVRRDYIRVAELFSRDWNDAKTQEDDFFGLATSLKSQGWTKDDVHRFAELLDTAAQELLPESPRPTIEAITAEFTRIFEGVQVKGGEQFLDGWARGYEGIARDLDAGTSVLDMWRDGIELLPGWQAEDYRTLSRLMRQQHRNLESQIQN